mmetsp:Transcript_27599/g.63971  ORF Transcript_27599/g.63971 Transcript_27599/m.63971 type:complete len:114 (-) Transcript_27599:280-621(-)
MKAALFVSLFNDKALNRKGRSGQQGECLHCALCGEWKHKGREKQQQRTKAQALCWNQLRDRLSARSVPENQSSRIVPLRSFVRMLVLGAQLFISHHRVLHKSAHAATNIRLLQ